MSGDSAECRRNHVNCWTACEAAGPAGQLSLSLSRCSLDQNVPRAFTSVWRNMQVIRQALMLKYDHLELMITSRLPDLSANLPQIQPTAASPWCWVRHHLQRSDEKMKV